MITARKNIVDQQTLGFYHCTNRGVRKTYPCGSEGLTGKDHSHRKDWLERRMFELCDIFSVDIYAYAILDNHYHIVLHLDPLAPLRWSDHEIAERWLNAFGGRLCQPELAKQREMKKQIIVADNTKLKKYRKRLGSLSWFMECLNEPRAKQNNQEENCTASFWEGRYSSQALLDEVAVFSCMAYVDLTPVRDKITDKLDESDHTSIKRRLDEIKQMNPQDAHTLLNSELSELSNQIPSKALSMFLNRYVELVEWTGMNIIHPNKTVIPLHIASCLKQFNLQHHHWFKQLENFEQHYCHVIGSVELMKEKARQLKKRCMKGMSAAKLFYKTSS